MVYVIFKQFFCKKVSKIGHSILFKKLFGDTFDTLINSYINLPLHGGQEIFFFFYKLGLVLNTV